MDLVADIGGTHARFALWDGVELHRISILKHRELPSFDGALQDYLSTVSGAKPRRCCLAVATPITGNTVTLTNGHWELSRPRLEENFGFEQVELVNDFTALAKGLPLLKDEDMVCFGGAAPVPDGPRALLGAGTGLGVSALIQAGGQSVALSGEGGHVSVPMGTAQDIAVVNRLQTVFGRVSLERILSGDGLRNLHWALDDSGTETLEQQPQASDISAAAQLKSAVRAEHALHIFTRMLGGFAGDLALVLGATGGVFIGGGIAAAVVDSLAEWGLRDAFEDKGRMQSIVQPIPLYVIKHPHAGLLGAAASLPQQSVSES